MKYCDFFTEIFSFAQIGQGKCSIPSDLQNPLHVPDAKTGHPEERCFPGFVYIHGKKIAIAKRPGQLRIFV